VLRAATDAEIAAFAAKARAAVVKHVVLPVADLSITELATLEHMRAKDVVAYGTKACALGETVAAKLTGFEVPPAFGVLFAYYQAHLQPNGLRQADRRVPGASARRRQPKVGLCEFFVDGHAAICGASLQSIRKVF